MVTSQSGRNVSTPAGVPTRPWVGAPGSAPQSLQTQFIQDLAPECDLQGGVYQLWLEDFLQETALNPGHRPKSWYEGVHQPELTPASDADTTCTLTIRPAASVHTGQGGLGRWRAAG